MQKNQRFLLGHFNRDNAKVGLTFALCKRLDILQFWQKKVPGSMLGHFSRTTKICGGAGHRGQPRPTHRAIKTVLVQLFLNFNLAMWATMATHLTIKTMHFLHFSLFFAMYAAHICILKWALEAGLEEILLKAATDTCSIYSFSILIPDQ